MKSNSRERAETLKAQARYDRRNRARTLTDMIDANRATTLEVTVVILIMAENSAYSR